MLGRPSHLQVSLGSARILLLAWLSCPYLSTVTAPPLASLHVIPALFPSPSPPRQWQSPT